MGEEPMQQEGYDLMAAAFEVYNELKHGFSEEIYQESLETELRLRQIQFSPQPELSINYKQQPLKKKLRPDLLVSRDIVVELKAVANIAREHETQLLNYLKASKKPVGYLINFGNAEKLEWKRYARTRKPQ
jgi:GxxExxY protein